MSEQVPLYMFCSHTQRKLCVLRIEANMATKYPRLCRPCQIRTYNTCSTTAERLHGKYNSCLLVIILVRPDRSMQEEGGWSLAGRTLVCAHIPLQQEMPRQVTLTGGTDSIARKKWRGERRWVSSFLHFTFYRVSRHDGSGRQEVAHTLSPQGSVSLSA